MPLFQFRYFLVLPFALFLVLFVLVCFVLFFVSFKEKLNKQLAAYSYEGGPDTFGPTSIAAKKNASLDPRMKGLVNDYLDIWYQSGGSLFNWFTVGAGSYDTQYGTW